MHNKWDKLKATFLNLQLQFCISIFLIHFNWMQLPEFFPITKNGSVKSCSIKFENIHSTSESFELFLPRKYMGKVNIYGKKNISKDFEIKKLCTKICLIYLEKIFWKGKRLVQIKSAVLEIVEVTVDTSRT